MERDYFLKKSGAWASGLPVHGVRLAFHWMEYPFLLTNVFSKHSKNGLEDFERHINVIASDYMKRWAMNEVKEGKLSEKTLDGFLIFKEQFDAKKVYDQIVSGTDNSAKIFLPVSNAVLEVRRFGDCFGMKIKSNNSGQAHVNGTKLLEEMCQDEGHYIIEFLHSIECIIPLPKKQAELNSKKINFLEVYQNLPRDCPEFQWDNIKDFSKRLTDSYVAENESEILPVKIGKYKTKKTELSIIAKLIHFNCDQQGKFVKYPPQWRNGNMKNTAVTNEFRFLDGGDLCLSMSLTNDLKPFSFETVDPELYVSYQQSILHMAGSALYLQLCAQQLADLSLRIV
ncbi:MAG: hypothetical protein A2271_01755 [Candidatus Moranbacteria bacterium RIFOXYA12_FULL_35_19]|nr:MAG: hypothetical protein UR78_C0016G0006 [Candidatus Moranbacteria bacterium GW2011_GWF2_35_39]OGI32412.1 MAG: hypothetical protein A2489_02215 [Candidatus Moranbacteria bacterium RIFOXYC12_FULL_36_13]OGI32989.1 MAG: hypothetical protein A2343_00690 [Candidatus Moranbacteria bacterium RIFOXYB12_FULL_35_8]OGI35496.1 MAG: hypothetical protein A2271_01755 [Candidatus Moranbacteria bacterium RIFOXYA12_FULL_35_19]